MNASQENKLIAQIAAAEIRLSDAYESENAVRIQRAESRLSDLLAQADAADVVYPPKA